MPRTTVQEADATTYEDWGEPITVRGSVRPAGGRVQAEQYGERLAYMLNMYVEDTAGVEEGAGACIIRTDKPDYRVVSIQTWSDHAVIGLEKLRNV